MVKNKDKDKIKDTIKKTTLLFHANDLRYFHYLVQLFDAVLILTKVQKMKLLTLYFFSASTLRRSVK